MRRANNGDLLMGIYKAFPELTLQNKGYEYLPKEIQSEYKNIIDVALELVQLSIPEATEFNNFTLKKDGRVYVRIQYRWDPEISFIGVGYFPVKEFKETIKNNRKK